MTTRDGLSTGERLLAFFRQQGFRRVDTSVLQPADTFVDLSGEDIRRRLFTTQDEAGHELCLRPEFTIPVCRKLIASGDPSGRYCYLGPVFRQRRGGPSEFLQVGIELIGEADTCPADADVIGLALDGFAAVGGGRMPDLRLGDMGLLHALLDALDLGGPDKRRLIRALAAGETSDQALLPEPRPAGSDYAGLLAAIEGQDPKAARAFVEDVISIAGIAPIGGRSAGEIAERFLSKAANRSGQVGERERDVLRRYLAIRADLDTAAEEIRQLAADERLDLSDALDLFDERIGFLAARGVDLAQLRFDAAFARTLDYYTGVIFEIRDRSEPGGAYLAAGGRYDRLLELIGATSPVPAVGCSFSFDATGEPTA